MIKCDCIFVLVSFRPPWWSPSSCSNSIIFKK